MQTLATKWRPHEFEDVCEQSLIIQILQRQLSLREFKNTYLFCGPSGCGKTTLARIFSDKINNGIGAPIEIDAASNNGVENVRQIISEATTRSLDGEYRIYIIDEAHGLSANAWQAFLKCIEEPPKYTIFIFCTTDPQKIPATILNRCMRFNFTRIPSASIKKRLEYICQQEKYRYDDESLNYISKICKGQMRDAITYLDKVVSYSTDISINSTLAALGNFSYETYFSMINALIDNRQDVILQIVETTYLNGYDLKVFLEQFIVFTLDIIKYIIFKRCDLLQIPVSFEESIKNSINFDNAGKYYQYVLNNLMDLKVAIKNDENIKNTIEAFLLKIANCI